MITIQTSVTESVDINLVAVWTAETPEEATAILREILDTADDRQEPRLHIRVTGDTTAASCRHHPLSPGTAGDPRR